MPMLMPAQLRSRDSIRRENGCPARPAGSSARKPESIQALETDVQHDARAPLYEPPSGMETTTTAKIPPHLDPHVARKLFSRTQRDPSTGCLLWTGCTTDGYGNIRIHNRIHSTHRLALEIELRRALEPHERACHACDNPRCVSVEPGHLFAGDNQINLADAARKGRIRSFVLTVEDVIQIRRAHEEDGETHAALGRRFGVTRSMIGHICRRRCWSGVAA